MEPTSSDAHGADRGEDEAVDVVGWEWLDGNGSGATAQGAAAPRGDGSQAPGADLMHLPLVLPDIKLTAKDEYVVMCAEVAGAGEAAELGEAGKAAADEEMHVAAAGKGPPNVGEMEEGAEGAVKKPRTE